MLEVCGFNQWLLALLKKMECDELILIQPDKKTRHKTDRRDAARLSELLWVNRERLLAGERVQGVRRVYIPAGAEADSRQVTSLRQRLSKQRTQTINRIKQILHKHNLIHHKPKGWIERAAQLPPARNSTKITPGNGNFKKTRVAIKNKTNRRTRTNIKKSERTFLRKKYAPTTSPTPRDSHEKEGTITE